MTTPSMTIMLNTKNVKTSNSFGSKQNVFCLASVNLFFLVLPCLELSPKFKDIVQSHTITVIQWPFIMKQIIINNCTKELHIITHSKHRETKMFQAHKRKVCQHWHIAIIITTKYLSITTDPEHFFVFSNMYFNIYLI